MPEYAFHQFILAAAEVAYAMKGLPDADREPLEARIAQSTVMFVVGEQVDAYRELRHVGYAADRIEHDRGRTQGPALAGCVAGI